MEEGLVAELHQQPYPQPGALLKVVQLERILEKTTKTVLGPLELRNIQKDMFPELALTAETAATEEIYQ